MSTPRLISDTRGVRHGEVLSVYLRDAGLEAEVEGTQMLSDCPQELWETLDAAAIAEERGAVMVKLRLPGEVPRFAAGSGLPADQPAWNTAAVATSTILVLT